MWQKISLGAQSVRITPETPFPAFTLHFCFWETKSYVGVSLILCVERCVLIHRPPHTHSRDSAGVWLLAPGCQVCACTQTDISLYVSSMYWCNSLRPISQVFPEFLSTGRKRYFSPHLFLPLVIFFWRSCHGISFSVYEHSPC